MKSRKIIIFAVALALCLSLSVNVLAFTDTVKSLEAHFSGIQIMVDGEKITPHDALGNYVEPFIVDGTTYLPVRAVGEALGKEVGWDSETRTVTVGHSPADEAAWKDLHPYTLDGTTKIYDGSVPTDKFTAAGVERYNGIVFHDKGGWRSDANIIWNTNGLYKTLNFTICCAAGQYNYTMKVYLGDDLYETYELHWNDVPKTLSIPVNYASNVRIELTGGNQANWKYAMYDISFEQ